MNIRFRRAYRSFSNWLQLQWKVRFPLWVGRQLYYGWMNGLVSSKFLINNPNLLDLMVEWELDDDRRRDRSSDDEGES